MVLHSQLDGFVRVTGKLAPRRHFLTEVSMSGLEGTNCLCMALCGLSLGTHCALSCTGCIFSGHSGCLEGFVFSLVFDSKYCCCCCKPPAVMSKAPLCLELTVHEKSARQLSCLTFISNSSGVELPVLSITSLEVY